MKMESSKTPRKTLRNQMQEIQEPYDGELKQGMEEKGELQAE